MATGPFPSLAGAFDAIPKPPPAPQRQSRLPSLAAPDLISATYTRLSALLFAEICAEAGLPPGVFNVVTGGAIITNYLEPSVSRSDEEARDPYQARDD